MSKTKTVLMTILFGILPIVIAALVAIRFVGSSGETPHEIAGAPAPPPPPKMQIVLTASRKLIPGTVLSTDDVMETTMLKSKVRKNYLKVTEGIDGEDASDIEGYAVRDPIFPGEPITDQAIVGPRERGFLAAVLRPGHRAISVRVNSATGAAGLIDPGNYVDVINRGTIAIGAGLHERYATTVAQNIRVIAVDQLVHRESGDDAVRKELTTATLEVRPEEAEKIVVIEGDGEIALSVRASPDAGQDERNHGTWLGTTLSKTILSKELIKLVRDERERTRETEKRKRTLEQIQTEKTIGELMGEDETMVEIKLLGGGMANQTLTFDEEEESEQRGINRWEKK